MSDFQEDAGTKTRVFSGIATDLAGCPAKSIRIFCEYRKRKTAGDFIFIGDLIMCKELIAREYVRGVDIIPIENHCRAYNLAISFRKAGQYTLKRLDNGAAAKGHNILAKSIKKESVTKHFDDIPENMRGLVGFWKEVTNTGSEHFIGKIRERKTPVLKGIYVTRFYNANNNNNTISRRAQERQYITFDNSIAGGTDASNPEITVDDFIKSVVKESKFAEANSTIIYGVSQENPVLKNMTKLSRLIDMYNDHKDWHINGIDNIYNCFYTGDYDLHDVIQFDDGNKDSKGKRVDGAIFAIARNLASDISKNPSYGRPKSLEFNVIRHGAQCGYFYYAINRLENLNLGLLRADLPVAMCNRGVWSIISQEKDLQNFYEANVKEKINVVWLSDEEKGLFVPKLQRYIAIISSTKGTEGSEKILAYIQKAIAEKNPPKGASASAE
jgi:hypothetical protein